jgi:hypothetical protein
MNLDDRIRHKIRIVEYFGGKPRQCCSVDDFSYLQLLQLATACSFGWWLMAGAGLL